MPDSFEQMLERFPGAFLSIRKDGPPTYQGEFPYRIIIDGNPDAFRLLAQLLNMMADKVERNLARDHLGWNFVAGTETIPQLHMDEGYLLSLVCDPETTADS